MDLESLRPDEIPYGGIGTYVRLGPIMLEKLAVLAIICAVIVFVVLFYRPKSRLTIVELRAPQRTKARFENDMRRKPSHAVIAEDYGQFFGTYEECRECVVSLKKDFGPLFHEATIVPAREADDNLFTDFKSNLSLSRLRNDLKGRAPKSDE